LSTIQPISTKWTTSSNGIFQIGFLKGVECIEVSDLSILSIRLQGCSQNIYDRTMVWCCHHRCWNNPPVVTMVSVQ